MLHVQQLLNEKSRESALHTVGPQHTVAEVIRRLCEHRIGALVVLHPDSGDMVGIVSERDVLHCLCPPAGQDDRLDGSRRVEQIMTRNVVTVKPDEKVGAAFRRMVRHRIRHLPVVEDGKPIGMISAGDLLETLHQQDEVKIHELSDFLGGTYDSRVF